MTLIVDASVVVAALVDSGPTGRWAETVLASDDLVAPHLMPVEVANILRRAELTGEITAGTASLSHEDLLDLRVDLVPYAPVARRAWELKANLTLYDAWYIAVAEAFEASLATLDARLARAPGPRCGFVIPEAGE